MLKNLKLQCRRFSHTFTFQFLPGRPFANAEEDEIDDDDSATIEEEGGNAGAADDADDSAEKKNVSPDADTQLLFTKPAVKVGAVELPAGNPVEFLVGKLGNF